MYQNVVNLIKEAVEAQSYFSFLCAKPSQVNEQFTDLSFPLGLLYFPSSSLTYNSAYAEFELFNITLELMDLDLIEDRTELSQLSVVATMYDYAKNVLAYLNQRSDGFDLFEISNVAINPLQSVTTNAHVTSGVRIDFQFRPEPIFATCYLG